jgi:hypothetical protein
MEILSGYNGKTQKFDVVRFDHPEAVPMEVKEQHQILIPRRFAALMNSDDIGGFKIVCQNIKKLV